VARYNHQKDSVDEDRIADERMNKGLAATSFLLDELWDVIRLGSKPNKAWSSTSAFGPILDIGHAEHFVRV
jgi:hypothetical protein